MSVSTSHPSIALRSRWPSTLVALACGALITIAALRYVPAWQGVVVPAAVAAKADEHAEDAHAGHDHAGHSEQSSIEVSDQARKNIGLQVTKIALGPFERTLAVPAVVVERPGRSELDITAALGGIVERIYPIQGETVEAGQPLFDVRLTHEELVQAQTEFLRLAEELDIVKQEIARLEPLSREGAIPVKTILDRNYEKRKLEGMMRAQREGLMLHGLSSEQVDGILADRKLLSGLTIKVPSGHATGNSDAKQLLQVQELNVERGQFVSAGEKMAVLSDHAELYIEGKAFEQDAGWLNKVVGADRPVTAVFDTVEKQYQEVPNLKVLYVADKVEPESRTLRFFVRLPNELLRDTKSPDGHRFIAWRYKPGQRLQLKIPVESWLKRIVLPAEAAVQDGVEWYVFQQNGDHFDRRAVHVEYRDPFHVVVANDGSLFPGDSVATVGAQQLQLALKNKAGGGVDPHAGHNH